MSTAPLTHHEIMKQAAPMTRAGFKINLSACDRSNRYIEFVALQPTGEDLSVIHTLEVDENGKQRLCRAVVHKTGLVSTLIATVSDLETAIDTFEQIPVSRQIQQEAGYTVARSYSLEPDYRLDDNAAILQLRFTCAYVQSLQIRIDSSTGGGMPADVWILGKSQNSSYIRDTLADGGDVPLNHRAARQLRNAALESSRDYATPKIPDDILAVLGPQWRPLRYQGDHWKGVLRQLGNWKSRTTKAERYIDDALSHLHDTLSKPPGQYQNAHAQARWQVYMRRLQPVMVLIGILALMPISWLLVSSGTVGIHPLALGLTPLLMVGVVALTAREIPVMEIPPRPQTLNSSAWQPFAGVTPAVPIQAQPDSTPEPVEVKST